MTTLHTLGILSNSFTWNAFPTVLKDFPYMLSTCWLLFLHSTVQLIPNHLNLVEARSSDAALHHSPSWSNSPYTAWRCVGSLSCCKTNDSPTMCKPNGMAAISEKHWFQLAQRDYKISQKLPVTFAKTFQTTFVIQL